MDMPSITTQGKDGVVCTTFELSLQAKGQLSAIVRKVQELGPTEQDVYGDIWLARANLAAGRLFFRVDAVARQPKIADLVKTLASLQACMEKADRMMSKPGIHSALESAGRARHGPGEPISRRHGRIIEIGKLANVAASDFSPHVRRGRRSDDFGAQKLVAELAEFWSKLLKKRPGYREGSSFLKAMDIVLAEAGIGNHDVRDLVRKGFK
jgi:hypothetical protein